MEFKPGDVVRTHAGTDPAFVRQFEKNSRTATGIISPMKGDGFTRWIRVKFENGHHTVYPIHGIELVTPRHYTIEPEFSLEEIEISEKLTQTG